MRLLLLAATSLEIEGFINYLKNEFRKLGSDHYKKSDLEIRICISGVGGIATVFSFMDILQDFKPDFALQAGIAGTFEKNRKLGSLAFVSSEVMSDLGAEDKDGFLDIFDLNLISKDELIFKGRELINPISEINFPWDIPFLKSSTVNLTAGKDNTIKERSEKYAIALESMEGAAFHYVCLKKNIPFLQIRSISNFIEPRDKSNWEIEKAITELNLWLVNQIFALSTYLSMLIKKKGDK